MRRPSLRRILVATTSEAESAVAELLQVQFAQPAVSFTDAGTGDVSVSVFLTKTKDWNRTTRAALAAGLKRLTHCGLKIGPGAVSCRTLRSQDWAQSWKRHFKPIEIGSALLIQPSWSKRRPRKGQAVIVLDPGLSFGTGQHPTTSFCLTQLAGLRDPRRPQSFLDLGTGSGILSIAASKLGYAPIDALDADPESLRVARGNARRNRVLSSVRLRKANLTRVPLRGARRYDVVCANLTADLLLQERKRILRRLKPEGTLVLAGILIKEFQNIRRAYAGEGLKLLASRVENEWRSGAFSLRKPVNTTLMRKRRSSAWQPVKQAAADVRRLQIQMAPVPYS